MLEETPERASYESAMRTVLRCPTTSEGGTKAEAKLGEAYQRLVITGQARQLKRKKYRR
jgi:hypothetical protein